MKKLLLGFLVVLGQVASAQTSKNFGDFNVVRVYDRIKVILVKSDENEIQIKNDRSDVEIVNKNGELKVRMMAPKFMQGDQVEVTVKYKDIKEIQASQGSRIISENTVDIANLTIISNEGSVLDLKINTDHLTARANSGGVIDISGKVDTQEILVNAGANYRGKELESDITVVTANTGGNAEVYATKNVTAKTRAGGSIEVYGNPKDKTTKNLIGGKIIFK